MLGVERSAGGRAWRARLDAAGEAAAMAIAQRLGHGELLSRVLAGRDVALDHVAAYLDPSLRQLLPDPHTLVAMDAAVERLAAAILHGQTVAVFGDYDVDGAASAALFADFLAASGTPFIIHIPDRIFEGYGPNVAAVRALHQAGANLLVAVDCGTVSFEPLAEAQKLGLDPIVFDHHQAGEQLPAALVVNPNRQDDLSGLGRLCAAGVVFLALVALNRRLRAAGFWTAARPEPDLLASLDLVALATVADVASLEGLNRAFVVKGLAVMRARARPGLRALFDIAGADGPPTPYHLGFLLGPRINAGGRIGDAALGAKLLSLTDPVEAESIARELDRLNRERQALEAATLEEADAMAAMAPLGQGAVIVGANHWHPGIVGLIASRLKDRQRRPAFAIAFDGATGTGSGRSMAGVDLGRVVRAAVDAGLLVKGGGHAMAAGITIARDRLDAFRTFVDEQVTAAVQQAWQSDALLIDATVSARGADAALVQSLDRAGPYGAGNPEPVFVLPAHRLMDVLPVGNGHLRLRVQSGDGARLDAIAFRVAGEPLGAFLQASRGTPVHLAGTLSLDRWGGRQSVRLRLLDAARVG